MSPHNEFIDQHRIAKHIKCFFTYSSNFTIRRYRGSNLIFCSAIKKKIMSFLLYYYLLYEYKLVEKHF